MPTRQLRQSSPKLMEAQKKEAAALVRKIAGLHRAISKLPSLSPTPETDALFTALVAACLPPSPVELFSRVIYR